jgi:REP element-mobilizing transposase RayT
VHRYFVDGILQLETMDGIKKYLVEIKPKAQLSAPKTTLKKKKSTIFYEQLQWAQNQAKWDSANKWCEKNGYRFAILTEEQLK